MVTTSHCPAVRARFASRLVLTLIGGAASILVAATSQAHESDQTTVRYEDLDLSQAADASILYGRLRAAANQVCVRLDIRDLRLQSLQRACVAHALDQAVADVNVGSLTALHRSDRTLRVAAGATPSRR
jgi:UrcA family protein